MPGKKRPEAGTGFVALLAASLIVYGASLGPAQATTIAYLDIAGSGIAPNQTVKLSTGPQQEVTAVSDNTGAVLFKDFKYIPEKSLAFTLSFPVKDSQNKVISNTILLDLDPFTGSVKAQGNVLPASSIVMNLSAEDSESMVANQTGYFKGSAYSTSGISKGVLKVTTSIVNVEQACCPRNFRPLPPVTITVSGMAPVGKKAANDIVQGTMTAYAETVTAPASYAVSVPQNMIDETWIKGFQNFGNEIAEALVSEMGMIGSFFDAQNQVNAQRALQVAQAKVAKKYLPSEALCRFASLGQGLAASGTISDGNKIAIAQALQRRETGAVNTLFANSTDNITEKRTEQFRKTYCNARDSNMALRRLCRTNDADTRYNKDVNYTRDFDIPLTFDIDFINPGNAASQAAQEDLLGLAENLFPSQPVYKVYNSEDFAQDGAGYRSLQAIRSVAKNSFLTAIAEKVRGTGNTEALTALLRSLGLANNGQVQSLMGEQPSYYAQMEALTKKVFQSPAFFVNLYDTPANVLRQRAAIRSIKLQQGDDLLKTLKRREMLLAVLLELKIRERSALVNQRINNASKPKPDDAATP